MAVSTQTPIPDSALLKATSQHRSLLLAVFVLSGFAGLIYQSVWSQYLGVFLGHAAYAQALVLAIFMGGMALGAMWVARVGENWRNLIRRYALFEALIGVLGLVFHWIFTGVMGFGFDVLMPAAGSAWLADLIRWSLAVVLILPQTVLLGMTFPLMSGGLIRRYPQQDGRTLGGLYFTNSIGAAVGVLTSTFVLLPWVGLPGTIVAAGILNLVVAALALWVARTPEPAPAAPVASAMPSTDETDAADAQAAAPVAAQQNDGEDSESRAHLLNLVLIATALSGAASFAYEVIWVRMLSLVFGSTLHAFELMLASFVAGIAFGGLWVRSRADTSPRPLRLVGWMQIAMGLATLFSLLLYSHTFDGVSWLLSSLSHNEEGYLLFTLGTAVISIAIMLPAAFFAGTTLPLFTVTLLRKGYGEKAIGQVYGWNTVGTIIGVFLTMHLLIPLLGLKLALILAALVDMGIGLYLLRFSEVNRREFWWFAAASAVVLLGAWAASAKVPLSPNMLASGVFRTGKPVLGTEENKADVVYYRDGKTASISVVSYPAKGMAVILTNGKPDAGIRFADNASPSEDEFTMALLGALPLALHGNPQHVGIIGFGSGMTSHTMLGDARLKSVDTIEIEPAIIEGARLFGKRVDRAYKDPRSNVVIDDAKAYFSAQQKKYDIVVSEPSNPWINGIGGLFSREFYRFVPHHLKDDGLFVQWIQLYEINDPLVGAIVNAMTPAFSDYEAWLLNGADLLIVAKPKGKIGELQPEAILKGLIGDDLKRLGISHPSQLQLRRVADASVLRGYGQLFSAYEPNSYYYPLLSLKAPKTLFTKSLAGTLPALGTGNNLLLEGLGVRQPLRSKVMASSLNVHPADVMTRLARRTADLLRGQGQGMGADGSTGTLDGSFESVTLLRELAARVCKNPDDRAAQQRFASQVYAVSNTTLAPLPRDMQQGVWIDPAWMPCGAGAVSADASRAFALLEALAGRDWKQARNLGENWLQQLPEKTEWRVFDELALFAVLVNLAQEKQWDELKTAEKKLGVNVTAPGGNGLLQARLLLLAMADAEAGVSGQ